MPTGLFNKLVVLVSVACRGQLCFLFVRHLFFLVLVTKLQFSWGSCSFHTFKCGVWEMASLTPSSRWQHKLAKMPHPLATTTHSERSKLMQTVRLQSGFFLSKKFSGKEKAFFLFWECASNTLRGAALSENAQKREPRDRAREEVPGDTAWVPESGYAWSSDLPLDFWFQEPIKFLSLLNWLEEHFSSLQCRQSWLANCNLKM